MPDKITDDEIIEALELCQLEDTTICESCPLGKFYPYCDDVISPATIDLINRQKAEIERLQKAIQVQEIMLGNQDYTINKAKAENENKNIVYCKDCEYLMFSDFEGECSKAYKGIVRPKDSCPYGKRRKEKNK